MTTAFYIGMRQHRRADGAPFLAGVADTEFVVPAGARVLLRRVREHDDDSGPAFVLVVAPLDPRGMTKAMQARATIDNAPAVRIDPRDEAEGGSAPC